MLAYSPLQWFTILGTPFFGSVLGIGYLLFAVGLWKVFAKAGRSRSHLRLRPTEEMLRFEPRSTSASGEPAEMLNLVPSHANESCDHYTVVSNRPARRLGLNRMYLCDFE
ncbi:MAG: hypothetical protein JNJ88_06590 [Planctomycetes bacterium]|nr:hypothetical protein [Planctomycetota bacterium]